MASGWQSRRLTGIRLLDAATCRCTTRLPTANCDTILAQGKTRTGRPRIAKVNRELVLQIASETGWGYSRILGELRKLGLGRISRQSVKNTLLEHGIDPGPKTRPRNVERVP